MKLAKDCLDVGLMTDDPEMVDFFATDVGLGDYEVLRVTKRVTQHRFELDGSIVKVNLVDGLDTQARSGYTDLSLATGELPIRNCEGPDGISVLVGAKSPHFSNVVIGLAVPEISRAEDYFGTTLGFAVENERVRIGRSTIRLLEGGPADQPDRVRGWTYVTLQIWDCDAETAGAVERGATLAQSAITLGETARFSMVADPWGNRIELSQRASLTGPLPT